MKYTKYILSIVIPFGLLYLVGCFNQSSFNASEWNETARDVISIFGCFFSLLCTALLIAKDFAEWK